MLIYKFSVPLTPRTQWNSDGKIPGYEKLWMEEKTLVARGRAESEAFGWDGDFSHFHISSLGRS